MDTIDRKVKQMIGAGVARAYGLPRPPTCVCGHTDHHHDDNEECTVEGCACTGWEDE